MTRFVTPVIALAAAVCGVVVLVPPALAASQTPTPASGPVSVSLAGRLDTAGLAEHPTLSRLTVTNTGAQPLGWSLRAGSAGESAARVSLEYWPAGSAGCAAAEVGSSAAGSTLAVGQSVQVCVRMTATTAPTAGDAPVVTVVAHSA